MATVSDGIPSFISEYQPDGTLVTSAIGSGVTGAKYVGVDVYGSNHDVYAADAASSSSAKVYVFAAGNLAGPPAHTIDGSNTPAGSLVFQGNYAEHIGVDQSNGDLYAVDGPPHRVVDRFTASGAYLSQFAYTGGLNGATDVSSTTPAAPTTATSTSTRSPTIPKAASAIRSRATATRSMPSTAPTSTSTHSPTKAYDADPKFANATQPQGVAIGVGADSGHLYWSMVSSPAASPAAARTSTATTPAPATSPTSPRRLRPTNGADVRAVLGASSDGSYVYFVANADLDGSGPATKRATARLERRQQPRQTSAASAASTSPTAATSPSSPASTPPSPTPRTTPGEIRRGQLDRHRAQQPGSRPRQRRRRSCSSAPSAGSAPTTTRARSAASTAAPTRSPDPARSSTATTPASRPRLRLLQPDRGCADRVGSACAIRYRRPEAARDEDTFTRNLSADGDRVFFETPDKLVAADVNGDAGCPKAVDTQPLPLALTSMSGRPRARGSCHSDAQNGGCLLSDLHRDGPDPLLFLDASTSGDDAFFFTRRAAGAPGRR